MKTFGFLMPTPEFAKICGGGQYNGYVAISRAYLTEGQDYQHWLDDMDGVMHGGCTLDVFSGECFKNREIVPVTDIDTNWSEYMVFGFDPAVRIVQTSKPLFVALVPISGIYFSIVIDSPADT